MEPLLEPVVIFENNKRTYQPGEIVSVALEYPSLIGIIKISSIKAFFNGIACTKWSRQKETIGKRLRPSTVMEEDQGLIDEEVLTQINHEVGTRSREFSFSSRMILDSVKKLDSIVTETESYIDQEVLVRGGSQEEIESLSAFQTYVFRYQLPDDIPSSFEGRFGHIRYSIRIIMDRLDAPSITTHVPFFVQTPLDLNQFPRASESIYIHMSRHLGFWCCKSLPLTVELRAPVSGYCPGETMTFVVEVDNRVSVNVNWVRAYFRKIVTYRGTDKDGRNLTKKAAIPLCAVERGPAVAGDFSHWSMCLKVPSNVPPSNLLHCSIIDLDYDLLVEAKISGNYHHMTDGRYLLIGTVPLDRPEEPQKMVSEEIDLEGGYEV